MKVGEVERERERERETLKWNPETPPHAEDARPMTLSARGWVNLAARAWIYLEGIGMAQWFVRVIVYVHMESKGIGTGNRPSSSF